jgi:diguanylate cyclase
LPREAVPFVRELLCELARRVPSTLAPQAPLPLDVADEADGCLEAARVLFAWFEVLGNQVGRQYEQLDGVFGRVLTGLGTADHKLHRAVHQTRDWIDEELAFSRSMLDVLAELRSRAVDDALPQNVELIDQMLLRLRAKEGRDAAEALSLSAHFEAVEQELAAARVELQQVEAQTRRALEQNLRDPLTGLWNRRAFEARLEEEVVRSYRYGTSLSLILWDVDRLGETNARFGHPTGDVLLQNVAGRILVLLRRSDFLARRSGGEFAVILPNTALRQAMAAADKIERALSSSPVPTPSGPLGVTVSLGVGSLEPEDTSEALAARSEEALHRAKTAGGGRTEPQDRQLRLVSLSEAD